MIGRVKNILPGGYGFIITEDGTNYFFHYSQYKGDWSVLQETVPPKGNEMPIVQFMPQDHKRGPRALSIELIDLT